MKINNKSIILFDGVCNLCNGFVQFVIKRDSRFNFMFCSLQSETAKEILSAHNKFVKNLNTVVLIEDGRLFTRSTAILRIIKKLDGGWKYLNVFALMPGFLGTRFTG